MRLIKYPDTYQYRTAIERVESNCKYHNVKKLPTIDFVGTVKLHGTNASIVWNGKDVWFQSRESILSETDHNEGFYQWGNTHKDILIEYLNPFLKDNEAVVLYGEWCGKGIKKGVGISSLDKMFVAFAMCTVNVGQVKSHGEYVLDDIKTWLDDSNLSTFMNKDINLHNTQNFKKCVISIDFNDPQKFADIVSEYIKEIEVECPVARRFGIIGSGEGLVFTGYYNSERLSFKIKCGKHAISKTKKVIPIDIEKLESVDNFCYYAVSENRLDQAIYETNATTKEDVPKVIQWVMKDIIKEESDTLVGNNLTMKDIQKTASKKVREMYIKYLSNV